MAEVTVDTVSQGPTKKGQDPLPEVLRVKYKLHPKMPALEGMGRHLKLFTDKIEVEDHSTPKQHSAVARLVMQMLDLRAHGRLDPSLQPILKEITG